MKNKAESNNTCKRITVGDLKDMIVKEMEELKVKDFVG